MRRHSLHPIVLASLLTLVPAVGQAALQRAGPPGSFGYPSWYQDASGLTFDLCSPTSQLELDGGWCLLLPPAPPATLPVAPETFPDQFFDEHFYWAAGGNLAFGAGRGAVLTLALEGAFAAGPVIPGDQIVFGRMRIVIPSLPADGTYTIYHPYGVWTFPGLVAGQRLFYTEDVGITCPPGQFDCALATAIGPFLLPSVTSGGPELPPIPLLDPATDPFAPAAATPYPGNAAAATPKYIADPARLGPVTGSPLAPFVSAADGLTYDHNIFRIEVLAPGATVPTLLASTNLFTLQGRVFEGTIPGLVTVERASYTRPVGGSPTGAQLDVLATGFAAISTRVPAGPPAAAGAAPALQFWDVPCSVDPVTGALGAPVAGGTPHAMVAAGAPGADCAVAGNCPNYWAQTAPQTVLPLTICVAQTNAVGPGGLVSAFYSKNVEDEVTVSSALYDPGPAMAFSLAATSSDAIVPPALTLVDFGPLTGGTYASTQLPAPATVHVTSAAGGTADFQVDTSVAAPPPTNVPVAANDTVTMSEDCSTAPATACATPQVIAPLANDTLAGAPIVFGPGVRLTITSPVRLGTTVLNADGTVGYTPNPNVNGTDGFSYTVSTIDPATGAVLATSNTATVSIAIAAVNDAPVAVNDTAGGFVGPTTVNVLANDTDPDGNADIVGVSNLSPVTPAGATAVLDATGRNVIVTATAPGTYTFSYQARDGAGVLSALPATVTVTIAAAETLTMAAPVEFRVTQLRWVATGTDTAPVGSLVTLMYANGPNAGFVIGTASVLAGGTWTFDVRGVTGLSNPTTAQATALTAVGIAGATATAPILLK